MRAEAAKRIRRWSFLPASGSRGLLSTEVFWEVVFWLWMIHPSPTERETAFGCCIEALCGRALHEFEDTVAAFDGEIARVVLKEIECRRSIN